MSDVCDTLNPVNQCPEDEISVCYAGKGMGKSFRIAGQATACSALAAVKTGTFIAECNHKAWELVKYPWRKSEKPEEIVTPRPVPRLPWEISTGDSRRPSEKAATPGINPTIFTEAERDSLMAQLEAAQAAVAEIRDAPNWRGGGSAF